MLDLLTALANYYYARGNTVQALHYLQRLLVREPCREDAHRQVMHCYLHLGQRAQALRQYQLCTQILAYEFAAQPEVAAIATLTTLSEATISGILTAAAAGGASGGATAVEAAIEELCEAMGAC